MSGTEEHELLQADDFAGILEDAGELVTVVDREARFVWLNAAARRYFCEDEGDCTGRCAFDFIHVEDRARTELAFQRWVEAPGTRSFSFENRQVDTSGGVRYVLWTVTRRVSPSGEFLHLASTGHDVSRFHEREARLARSEARLRALFRGILDALVVIDDHGRILDASESVRDVFGWEPSDLVGRNISLLMPEPYRSEHDGYLHRYRRTGRTNILDTTRTFTVVRSDGSETTCELSVSRVDVPGGETLFLGSFRDVAERHRTMRALRESEARFRAVFDQEYQFIGILQPDGTLLETNRAGLAVARVTREQVIGRLLWEGPWFRHSAAQRERIRSAIERAAEGELVCEEVEIVSADGDLRTIDFSVKPLVDEDGCVQLLIPEGRDITALKRAQERETGMLRALAAIGESASILVHEIKNPITAVNLALAAVAEKLGEDQRAIIEDLSRRMKKLEDTMRRTLSFAKPLEVERRAAPVADVFEDVRVLLAPELEEREIQYVVEPLEPGLAMHVDVGLLEELLTNLVRNSLEALEERGHVWLRAHASGDDVVLEVEDDGPGVPARQRETLFEPFHTSKEAGTGLGLAFCRKIAEEHGGSITCADPEEGALFRIVLPRAGVRRSS